MVRGSVVYCQYYSTALISFLIDVQIEQISRQLRCEAERRFSYLAADECVVVRTQDTDEAANGKSRILVAYDQALRDVHHLEAYYLSIINDLVIDHSLILRSNSLALSNIKHRV